MCVCVYRASLFPRRCHDTLSTKLGRWFKSKHGYVAQSPGAISQVSKPSFKYFHEDEWVWKKAVAFSSGKSAPTKTDWIFKNHWLLWGGEREKVLYRIDFHQNVGGNTFSSLLDSFRFIIFDLTLERNCLFK